MPNVDFIPYFEQHKLSLEALGADKASNRMGLLDDMNTGVKQLTPPVSDEDKKEITRIFTEVEANINALTDADVKNKELAYFNDVKTNFAAKNAAVATTTAPAATMQQIPATNQTADPTDPDDLTIRTDNNKELKYEPAYENMFGPDKNGHSKSAVEIIIAGLNDYRSQALRHYFSRIFMVLKVGAENSRLGREISGFEAQKEKLIKAGVGGGRVEALDAKIAGCKDRIAKNLEGYDSVGAALKDALRNNEFNRDSDLGRKEKKLIDSKIRDGKTGYSPALNYYAPRNSQDPNHQAKAVKAAKSLSTVSPSTVASPSTVVSNSTVAPPPSTVVSSSTAARASALAPNPVSGGPTITTTMPMLPLRLVPRLIESGSAIVPLNAISARVNSPLSILAPPPAQPVTATVVVPSVPSSPTTRQGL